MAKKRVGKQPKKFKATTKAGKKAEKIAAARATKTPKVRQIRKGRGSVVDVATNGKEPARVTTFRPNGAESKQAIPDTSDLRLPAIELPSPEDSVKLLQELAELVDQSARAGKRYADLKELTKLAKDKYDGLNEQIVSRLRQATHASDLPLFADVDKREKDQKAMEAGPEAIQPEGSDVASEGGADPAGLIPESEPEPGRALEPTPESDVPTASEPVLEMDPAEVPF